MHAATGPDGVVALEVVHPHLLETRGFFKRFMREAQLGQSIRHDSVVRTLDCDQELAGGTATSFLVMEQIEGQTLSELLGDLERVPEELCRHVAREICKGLSAIHEARVVHCDLEPDNVIIARGAAVAREGNVRPADDCIVKVMDLGAAKLSDGATKLSRSGAFVDSVEYAAPEQFKGGGVDGRTDLHALGVLLYELSSGQPPNRGGSFHEVQGRVCDQDARRLGEINPQLSATDRGLNPSRPRRSPERDPRPGGDRLRHLPPERLGRRPDESLHEVQVATRVASCRARLKSSGASRHRRPG